MDDQTIHIECEGATTINIDDLHELHHFKTMTDQHYVHGRNSITELGFSFPLFFWEDADGKKWAIDGHQRLRILKRMRDEGFTIPSLPADRIFAKDRVEAKKKLVAAESRYADPDASEFADFLADDGLSFEDVSDYMDIPDLEPELWTGKNDVVEDEPPAVNDKEPAISQLGEVYQLGRHRLLCGDSTKIEDVEKLMGGQKADMVFTDPPYGVDRGGGFGGFGGFGKPIARRNYENNEWDKERISKDAFDNMFTISEKIIIFGGNFYTDYLPASGHWLVWDKKQTMPTFGDCELAWTNSDRKSIKKYEVEYNGLLGKEAERFHPTQKPIKLCAEIIRDYSEENNSIIDLFGGSGSTLIACEQTNRACYCLEIDNKYTDVIIKRWMKFTGKRAYKIIDVEGNQCNIPVKFADESFMESKILQEDSEVLSEESQNTVQKPVGQSEPR